MPLRNLLRATRRAIQKSLLAKLLLLTAPAVFLTVLGLTLILPQWVSTGVSELHRTQLVRQSAMLELTLQHAFMTNDKELVESTLENASREGDLLSLRLLSPESVIIASSAPDEAGVRLRDTDELCLPCHTPGRTTSPPVVRVASVSGNSSSLITAQPLENQAACQRCHEASIPILGVLLMESTTDGLDLSVERLSWGLAVGGGVFLELTLALMIVLLHRSVVSPLRKLSTSLGWHEQDRDEIATVSSHIALLEESLSRSQQESAARSDDLEALLTITEATGGSLSIGQVLQQALDTVLSVVGFEAGGMRLWEPEQGCFRLVAHRGMTPQMVRDLSCVPEGVGFQGEAAATLGPVFSPDLRNDPRTRSHSALEAGFTSLICAPLVAGDTLVGIMELATRDTRDWTPFELRWVAAIGHQIGIAVHRIQLSRQTQDLAVIEERGRVSQELHDGLAQLIGSIRAKAEEIQLSLDSRDWSAVRQNAREVEQTALDAYASLRQELLGLRDPLSSSDGLAPLLEAFLDRFKRQWGIEAEFRHIGEAAHSPSIGVEVQLLRIVQEAITNVRRHAEATRVNVTLEEFEDLLRVTVEDNGRGFAPDNEAGEGHLGLRIMRERAASVGGHLTIHSAECGGTVVSIDAPLHPAEPTSYEGETR
jgi:signal transduction histidine kinase